MEDYRKVLCMSDLTNGVKTNNDFSHLIAKTKLHMWYIFEDKKLFNSVITNFFLAPRNALSRSIIQADTL